MKAVFKKVLSDRSGEKEGKDWRIIEFLVETIGEYPKNVKLSAFGKLAETVSKLKENDQIDYEFEVMAKEWNGNWYNEVKAWKIDVIAWKKGEREAAMVAETLGSQEVTDEMPF